MKSQINPNLFGSARTRDWAKRAILRETDGDYRALKKETNTSTPAQLREIQRMPVRDTKPPQGERGQMKPLGSGEWSMKV